jgi:hypothetical protein
MTCATRFTTLGGRRLVHLFVEIAQLVLEGLVSEVQAVVALVLHARTNL